MYWLTLDAHIIPDRQRWGQGYGVKRYTPNELEAISRDIVSHPQPHDDVRYFAMPLQYLESNSSLRVPPGHDAPAHPNRELGEPDHLDESFPTSYDKKRLIPKSLRQHVRERGWKTDQHFRPCNPFAISLLAHSQIGLATGIGEGFFWGENQRVNAVIVHNERTLLMVKDDDVTLIDGYITPNDYDVDPQSWKKGNRPLEKKGILAAALRKTALEAGLSELHPASMELVYGSRPLRPHHTLHFWTVEYTVRITLDPSRPVQTDQSAAQWVRLSELHRCLAHMPPEQAKGLVAAVG